MADPEEVRKPCIRSSPVPAGLSRRRPCPEDGVGGQDQTVDDHPPDRPAQEPPRIALSLVVITLNEERNIGRCLASLEGLADESVVVDAGSTDRTWEIAAAAGARVLERGFDTFGGQKQFALEQARGEWILCLDADEWLDRGARDAIRIILSGTIDSRVNGLSLRLATFYLGRWVKHGPWTGERKLRLVRRGCARWDPSSVHESLRLEHGGERLLEGRILHLPYRDLSHHLAKLDRYTDVIAVRDVQVSRIRALYGVTLEPWLVLLHRYFIQQGFRDGLQGLIGCGMTGFYFFLRYSKILLQQRRLGQCRPPLDPS